MLQPNKTCQIGERWHFRAGVYILVAPRRYVKVGVSSHIPKRLQSLKTSCPFPLELAAVIPGSVQMERTIQHALRYLPRHLEWFKWGKGVQEFIRTCRSQELWMQRIMVDALSLAPWLSESDWHGCIAELQREALPIIVKAANQAHIPHPLVVL